jgi:hypothetical protein
LVSVLDAKGAPTPVERTLIAPPRSRAGPITAGERATLQSLSPVARKYDEAVDRERAHELLRERAEQVRSAAEAEKQRKADEKAVSPPTRKRRARSARAPARSASASATAA